LPQLVERVRNRVDGDLAGQFSDRMSAHSIGHDKQVPALLPSFLIGGQLHDARILIVLASETDISQGGIANLLFPQHADFYSAPSRQTLSRCTVQSTGSDTY
jgi:hypothetical protein